ncbi:cytochrome c oxidase assembly protein subunit 15 [Rhodovulum imhoffii]|uniref:Cytochrome c oxidase assembly protein subunit 15 n=1 Tax=Rhodovulum imhoffii TaxID=365340 RepID=A0A2T5BT83_9RHOB|nr:COX15/CtaA family protein [Rhodovulum imhoffii]MBK5932978.1 hypothetical protein [Rhodovulum imhoffii]PTN02646.1 cytochrome c oxidase assembly protein subunit 15 [Rhodovulum imhoffii]
MSKTRSIFEEVGTEAPVEKPLVQPGAIDRAARRGARGAVRIWLVLLAVVAMVFVVTSGVTRVSGTALDIPGWHPFYGGLPLDSARMQDAQEAYAQTGADPGRYSALYWWNWGQRQLDRLILVLWGLGFLGFLMFRKLPKGWTLRVLGIGLLSGLLVGAGILRHAGGLADPYAAAVQVGMGYGLVGVLLWLGFRLRRSEVELLQARRARDTGAFGLATGIMHLAFVQVLLGGVLGALDAGRGFADWPLMAGGILPPEMFTLTPVWTNLFENAGSVQFFHRILGYCVAILGLGAWLKARRSANRHTRRAFDWMMVILFGQVVLGVGTVLYAAQWHMALTHQIGAVLAWGLILRARFLAQYPVAQSIRGSA